MSTTIKNWANKTDAGNGSKAICRVSNVLRSPSPDPRRSADTKSLMKIIFGIILLFATGIAVSADDLDKHATIEIAVYQSTKSGIASTPDVKQWMQQKLIVSQTFTMKVPNSIKFKTTIDGKVYDFELNAPDSSSGNILENCKISFTGIPTPIKFDRVPAVLNEWMSCASQSTETRQSYLGTMVVAKYTKSER